MFTLGVRLWTGKDMAYPSRFSILIDFETRMSSMRTYIDNNRIDSKTYMMLTPGIAMNGEIYEMDVICSCEDENLVGVVEFDSSLGAFVAYINDNPVYITDNMRNYEIVGNIFEDWDFVKDLIKNQEKFEKIIEETRLLNEENERQAELKAKKEEEKKLKEQAEALKVSEEPEKVEEGTETVSEVEIVVPEINEEEPKIEETKNEVTENSVTIEEQKQDNDTQVQETPEIEISEIPEEILPVFDEIELPEIPDGLEATEFDASEISDFDVFPDDAPMLEEPVEPDFEFEDDIQTDIKLYVDGQGGKVEADGSYSYIMQCGDYERIDKGFIRNTTKQRMELQAVIAALSALTTKCNVKIYTTSQYLIVPFLKGWITRWKANDWKKEDKEEVKNKDLWEELYELYSTQDIEWEFIKPGSSIVEVLRCIDLSKEALVENK